MTTNHHTPIPASPKQPANAATLNAPLSELDNAITDHETRIGSLEGDMPEPSGVPTEYYNGSGGWTVPAGTGASVDGHVIKDEGVSLPQRASIDFVGAGVAVTNEAGGTRVAIPGGVTDHGGLMGLNDPDHVAGSIGFTATDKLLGRLSSGAGAGEEIPLTAAGRALLDDADAAAQRVTLEINHLISPSLFVNGGLSYFQRQDPTVLTAFANRTYWADHWFTEHDASGGSGVQFRRWSLDDASIPSPAPTYSDTFAQIKNASASAAGILWSQVIESHNAIALRGQVMSLLGSVMASSGTPTLNYKVYAWSGVRDHADCKKLVSSWSSHVPTFNTTTLTALATGSIVLSSSVWQQLSAVLTAPASGARNIIVCFWVEGLAVGDSVYFTEADMYAGNINQIWNPRPIGQELALCLRFYEKSFSQNVAPAQAAGTDGVGFTTCIGASTYTRIMAFYKAIKRTVPTIITFNPTSANSQMRGAAGDYSGTTIVFNSDSSFGVFAIANASSTVGEYATIHWTSNAEI